MVRFCLRFGCLRLWCAPCYDRVIAMMAGSRVWWLPESPAYRGFTFELPEITGQYLSQRWWRTAVVDGPPSWGPSPAPVVLIIDELGYLLMPSGDAAAMLGRLLDRKCGVRNHG